MYDARWGEGLLMQLDFTTAGTDKRSAEFAAYENFTSTLSSKDYFDLVKMLALIHHRQYCHRHRMPSHSEHGRLTQNNPPTYTCMTVWQFDVRSLACLG